ncbi:MAG TPA: methyltransferase [Rhizomicrobium sp.]|jgi:protein-S-isoprenylcysteine O-methyltransferase Ste14
MLQRILAQILSGQAKSISLLLWAAFLFVYFLPSVLAFRRGHRHFLVILVLNILVSPAQGVILHYVWPDILVVDPHNPLNVALAACIANLGIGWILLMIWALGPGEPDPRLLGFQETKYYDAIAALPLILWFAYGALQLRAVLARDWALIAGGTASLFVFVQFFALLAAAAFDLLLVYMLAVRDRPVARAQGVLPRAFGVIGTFMGVGIIQLPVAHLTLPMQILAAVLIGVGSLGSLLVLSRLGKSFSIMPEARKLVTGGPYAFVRHPLYTVEIITIIGTAMQFEGPWSWIIALVVVMLLWIRSHYEEQVLAGAYPEYGEYRARTKRFIPGVI